MATSIQITNYKIYEDEDSPMDLGKKGFAFSKVDQKRLK